MPTSDNTTNDGETTVTEEEAYDQLSWAERFAVAQSSGVMTDDSWGDVGLNKETKKAATTTA